MLATDDGAAGVGERRFRDQRGIGLSDRPEDGYDTGTRAGDLAALMPALGHERFAVVVFGWELDAAAKKLLADVIAYYVAAVRHGKRTPASVRVLPVVWRPGREGDL